MDCDRRRLIIKRWLSIFSLTLVALGITAFIQKPFIIRMSAWFEGILNEWTFWISMLLCVLVVFGVVFFLRRIGGFRYKDIDLIYSWLNPPTWYAVALVCCLFPCLSYLYDTSKYEPLDLYINTGVWVALFLPNMLIHFFCFILWPFGKVKEQESTTLSHGTNFEQICNSPEKLIEWLKKETPIDSEEADLFETSVIARRIADKVEIANIFFAGQYGSGKTSTLNLAANILKRRNVIVLSVSAWAYDEGKLVGYVLQHVIREISKHTDCVSESFLPLRFQNTFTKLDLGALNFIKLILHFETPEELIRKIDHILQRYGQKLVVFLEDIDRNPYLNIEHEAYSLFNYFAETDNISFVVTHGGH